MNLPTEAFSALLKSVDLLKSSEAEGVLGPQVARRLDELVSTVQAGIDRGQDQIATEDIIWPDVSVPMSAQDQRALCQVLESILQAALAPTPKPSTSLAFAAAIQQCPRSTPSQCPSTSLAMASAMQRFEGDLELFKEVLEVFLQNAPVILSKVRTGITDGDAQQVAELAKELSGSAANVGAESIRAVAERLEFDTREASSPHMLRGLESLEQELQRLRSIVTNGQARPESRPD